jgi:uncharacterized protein (DUF1778 family)
MKKLGRPALPENKAKKVFSFRLSDDERNKIEIAAKRENKPITKWARDVLIAAAKWKM